LEKPEFDKAKEVEDKISELFKSNEYDRLVKPNHAFVIFETQEGLESVTTNGKPYSIKCENLKG